MGYISRRYDGSCISRDDELWSKRGEIEERTPPSIYIIRFLKARLSVGQTRGTLVNVRAAGGDTPARATGVSWRKWYDPLCGATGVQPARAV